MSLGCGCPTHIVSVFRAVCDKAGSFDSNLEDMQGTHSAATRECEFVTWETFKFDHGCSNFSAPQYACRYQDSAPLYGPGPHSFVRKQFHPPSCHAAPLFLHRGGGARLWRTEPDTTLSHSRQPTPPTNGSRPFDMGMMDR